MQSSTFGENYNAPCMQRGLSAIAEHIVSSVFHQLMAVRPIPDYMYRPTVVCRQSKEYQVSSLDVFSSAGYMAYLFQRTVNILVRL